MSNIVLLSAWMQSQVEFWRKTQYPGYDVSSFGRIRSWRTVTRLMGTAGGTERSVRTAARIMLQTPTKQGYCNAAMRTLDEDRIRTHKSHRVVAEAFIPNPLGLPEVNHKTGVKSDNRVDNLEWASHGDNVRHAFATGLYKRGRNDGDVRAMRQLFNEGHRVGEIARLFGYCHQYVSDIVRRKARTSVV